MFLARKATLNYERKSYPGLALVCDSTAMNGEDPPVKSILSKSMFLARKATLSPKRKSNRGLARVCDSTAMNGEDPPVKSIMMLPDDMLLNCLARISRLCYPTLSLVSKRFRSLCTSTELYQTRTLLGRTESCLYVCLRSSTNSNNPRRWFTLSRRPNSLTKVLVPVSSAKSPCDSCSDAVVVGPNIYAIGGLVNNNASTSVMVMDCHSHTWREAPSMRVARSLPSACVLDGKIYVMGGCDKPNSTNWIEVFDTNTQTWEVLQIPNKKEICQDSRYESVGYEGNVHVRSREKNVTCKLYKGRWRAVDLPMDMGWARSISFCVIANMFYRYTVLSIDWYDPKARLWRALHGLKDLKGLPSFYGNADVKLANHGGKMVVLWEKYGHVENHRQKAIWCAEIALVRHQNREIWGTLEWYGEVFISSEPYGLVHALATTI